VISERELLRSASDLDEIKENSMKCSKCSSFEMYREDDRRAEIVIYACLKCGKRIYQGYPQKQEGVVRLIDWKTLKETHCAQ